MRSLLKTVACSVIISAVCACIGWPVSLAAQESASTKTSGGTVGTLPVTPPDEQRAELLAGHVRLLSRTIDDAIDDLRDGELKQFATSYKRMVTAYRQLSDHVADAAESVGEAQTKILLAQDSLNDLSLQSSSTPEARGKLTEDLRKIRAMLLARLGALRQQYEAGAAERRQQVLAQIQGLVARINQMDQLDQTVREGSQPLLPGLAASDLQRQLDAVSQALNEEERTLLAAADSIGLLVESTTDEMQRTIGLLAIKAQLPQQQLARLSETRAAVQELMSEVVHAHNQATATALDILGQNDGPDAPANPDELLREADSLLGKKMRNED